MQWPTGLMILRGQGLSMTNRQEDICNSRVAFATEITENTSCLHKGWVQLKQTVRDNPPGQCQAGQILRPTLVLVDTEEDGLEDKGELVAKE